VAGYIRNANQRKQGNSTTRLVEKRARAEGFVETRKRGPEKRQLEKQNAVANLGGAEKPESQKMRGSAAMRGALRGADPDGRGLGPWGRDSPAV